MPLRDHLKFLGQYVWKPAVVGAVAPSSRGLARKMTEWIDWPNVRAVAEYGPGTGAFTGRILSSMSPGTRFFAVEVNPNFVETMSRRHPNVDVVQDSVKNVPEICRKEGIEQLDAVISGLPWAAFRKEDQTDYLDAMMEVLKLNGQFVTFAYL
ncbi:MAG: class I SAM-dependent methyltransferase, partial [Planctomycetota bacterium]